ncbi:ASCH domain [Edwardsiella hoshinae]|uniref:N(4)-acetylcytidine amidohydrolase n=2 Tax=Edwardsiella hoshinae TaxID=93378 RepID=A0A376DGH1_9GAMM|nr:ASCH domain [Edwardsiella hoshinae]
MQMKPDITFYQRFAADILAGRKTITLRDHSESHFHPGQRLTVGYYEDARLFCVLEVLSVTPLAFSQLNEQHAAQENMSLAELRSVIQEIYPHQDKLYMIAFRLVQRLD